MKRTHAAALVVLVALATPALTGCFSGQAATTNMQATMNSGNGVDATAGPIHVEAATLVLGPEGSSSATLSARIVNTGPEADVLTSVLIGGKPAYVTPDAGQVAPGASVPFGYESTSWINAYGFESPASVYVPVVLTFEKAGTVQMSILTVPPVGYYEGIAPQPATAPTL